MAEGFKDFAPGDILTAADVDDYLMQQSVMVFADASARTTALSSVLREGMMSYLKDTDTVEVYDGSAWVGIGGVANANFTDTATGTFSSGGTNYKYLVFKSSGTITFDTAGLADFLVVAGGAGGNAQFTTQLAAGAGGAGGVIDRTGVYVEAGTYTITVGGGGSGGRGRANSMQGSDSSVGTLLQAMGGGGGGAGGHTSTSGYTIQMAAITTAGGSGGGAGQLTSMYGIAGLGVPGQGYYGGGMGTGGGHYVGGGGGGAGGRGYPADYAAGAPDGVAADGGVGGITTIITDTIATAQSVGEVDSGNVYFGGGGGGAAHITTYCGTGGLGGGADAPTTAAAGNAGTAYTGGGGSAGRDQSSGGNGGSGCVIVRVAV